MGIRDTDHGSKFIGDMEDILDDVLRGRTFTMTPLRAKGAPFSFVPIDELIIATGKLDRRLEWREDGFMWAIIDRFGDTARLMRAGSPEAMVDSMNMEAAAMIMAEGTPAARLLQEK